MSSTDWIEKVSQENWPAARVRNVVKAFEEERARQWMPLRNPPPKRMPREKALEWLAKTAGIPVDDLKLTRPVHFVQQYVMGSCEQHALVNAIRVVHGTSANALYSNDEKDCAPEWMLGLARQQLIDSLTAAAAAEAPAPAFVVVPEVDLGLFPAPPVPTWAPVAAAPAAPAEVYPHRERHDDYDADEHLFEPPPVALPTMAEVAQRLVSLGERVDAHVAEEQKKRDREALNRLSASEMELGLIDDALDHMHAGQQSPANIVGRLAAIIARITTMDI